MAPARGTIDEYLEPLRGPRRAALEELRRTIRELLPDAEECISYGIPAFRLQGAVVAGFAATGSGCSYYPFSGATLSALAGELQGYRRTKSALHFDPARPLPAGVVRELLRARMAEAVATKAKARARAGKTKPKAKAPVEAPRVNRGRTRAARGDARGGSSGRRARTGGNIRASRRP